MLQITRFEKINRYIKFKLDAVSKMKKCGKVCIDEETYLDPKSANEPNHTGIDKIFDFEPEGEFISIRANNCVIRGKWCYEVLLFSHDIAQIGWVSYL
jgi:hypothetical protein